MNETADQLVALAALLALGCGIAGVTLTKDAHRSVPRRRASGVAVALLVAALVLPSVAVACWFLSMAGSS